MRWLILLGCSYLVIVAVMYLVQSRMLYFPSAGTSVPPRTLGLQLWPDDEAPIGFVSMSAPAEPEGTFLVWHGNAGSALDRFYFIHALESRGFRVVLAEYPGYGGRPGKPGEESFVSDAVHATTIAAEQYGGPLYLLGESLGCAVATGVVARLPERVRGVVLVTPWLNLPDLAQVHYPFVPAKWMVRDKYDNARNLRDYDGPVAVAMSERDEIIPPRHTEELFASIPSEKRLWVFEERGHNSWPVEAGEAWWGEALEFVAGSSSRPAKGVDDSPDRSYPPPR